jgi:hypothetical protein
VNAKVCKTEVFLLENFHLKIVEKRRGGTKRLTSSDCFFILSKQIKETSPGRTFFCKIHERKRKKLGNFER